MELGQWVLEQAVEWQDRLGDRAPQRISVNLSARQLEDPRFVDRVAELLRRSGLDPRIVNNLIGFTDDFGIDAVAEGVETLARAARLHEAGYQFAQGYLFGRPMSAAALEDLFTVTASATV